MSLLTKNRLRKFNIGLLIITRIESKRFKSKAKSEINGISITEILISRLLKVSHPGNIFIITSKSNKNKFYIELCKKYKIGYFEGSKYNVLSRIINCCKINKFENIFRLTGDNPFVDTDIIKKSVSLFLKKKADYYLCNNIIRGSRTELITLKSLIKLSKIIIDPNSTEYLSYFYFRPNIFNILIYKLKIYHKNEKKLSLSVDNEYQIKLLNFVLQGLNNLNLISRKKIIFLIEKKKILKKFKIKSHNLIPVVTNKYDVRIKGDKSNVLIKSLY